MESQLALFPGTALAVSVARAPAHIPEAEPMPLQGSAEQMGLFDAPLQRLRAALDAVALADLARALCLLEGIAPELHRLVPSTLRRVSELRQELERARAQPQSARVSTYLELGRSLSAEVEPWLSLGRALISRAAADLGPADGVLIGRLLLEARELVRARSVLLAVPGPAHAAALFALGDVESSLDDRSAARRYYRDALLLDPFDAAFDCVADEEVARLPYLAEFEVEVDGDPRAWCAPVGIVAGVLPRPREVAGELPMPSNVSQDRLSMLGRARQFVDGLVRAGWPDVRMSREALLETRRCLKRASAPLFMWYMARQVNGP
jgi:tetratricopeptide (TPR) repeat protein